MARITLKGSPLTTSGDLPAVGEDAPPFDLVKSDLTTLASGDQAGRRVILNIFPSVDTPTCAASVRRFNIEAARLPRTALVCVPMDLPSPSAVSGEPRALQG